MEMCKEKFGNEYTEKKCASIPGSLGDIITEIEKAELFTAKFYELTRTISTDQEKFMILTALLHAGVGPNLIREAGILTL